MAESYERELERVRKSRAEFEASQDEVERRKQDYFTSVRTLHEAGMPLREIASALGLSHQRVHQMVEEATGKKHSALRRKIAKQGGVALCLIVAAVAGFAALQPTGTTTPPSAGVAAPKVACRNEVLHVRVQKERKPLLKTCSLGSVPKKSFEIQRECGRKYGDLVFEIRSNS